MSEDISKKVTALQGRHPLFWLDLLLPVMLLALLTPLFHYHTWDIDMQRWFFHSTRGWESGEMGLFQLLYRFGNLPALLLCLAAVFVLIRGFSSARYGAWRKLAIYLTAVMIIGPGLLVNTLLKDRWGRPRPREVIEFGGKYAYEAPLEIDPSSPGKSFPCGHATMGFFFFAPAFLLRRKSMAASIALAVMAGVYGFAIGIARMAQGGHFASDVVWAGALIWIVAGALFYLMKLDIKPFSQTTFKANPRLKTGWKVLLWILGLGLIVGVGLATPYNSRRSYKWADKSSVNILMDEGDLSIGFSDSSNLKSVSGGFGFPGSKMKWNKRLADSDSLSGISFRLRRSGLFTEINNKTTLRADSLETKRLYARLEKGDARINGEGMQSLAAIEVTIMDGDLELLLPPDMEIALVVEKATEIENQHPKARIKSAGDASLCRLNVPRGKLSIKSADK